MAGLDAGLVSAGLLRRFDVKILDSWDEVIVGRVHREGAGARLGLPLFKLPPY